MPLLDRPAAAKAAGFDCIEVWWPFPGEPDPGRERIAEFVTAVQGAEVEVVSLNFDTGDATAGERGLM
ncbi:MAG: hydroxypyruvate isomerase, partial [Acidimicrobiia bacterium]